MPTVTPINILKQWFETGDKPTQAQFYALLDSYRHKNQKIHFDDLDDELQSAIAGSGVGLFITAENVDNVELPAGLYDKIIVLGTNGQTFNIGTTVGGNDVADGLPISNGFASFVYDINLSAIATLYFTGLSGTYTIKIRRS